ncbi:Kunitz-type protease inhibitor [Fasciola hepatica]|uniref:Kunitz-type protease inhibitor n=1 Tax=Fasciola hepatica TaxID=6192 RepID=A0A2H1C3I7_FASHE|nr:Kunitz-type protease inhibitor [Fasciola hepatica]
MSPTQSAYKFNMRNLVCFVFLLISYLTFTFMQTASADAPGPEVFCYYPQDRGSCRRNIRRIYYNHANKRCEIFSYGGCGGNANNFGSLTNCYRACEDR